MYTGKMPSPQNGISAAAQHPGERGRPGDKENRSQDAGACSVGRRDRFLRKGVHVAGPRARRGVTFAVTAGRQGQGPAVVLVENQVGGEDARRAHLFLETRGAVKRRLVPPTTAQGLIGAAAALLGRRHGRPLEFGHDLRFGVGHDRGHERQPGREETLEAVLVAVARHERLALKVGHDVAAVFGREELAEGGAQQAVDARLPLGICIGLWEIESVSLDTPQIRNSIHLPSYTCTRRR